MLGRPVSSLSEQAGNCNRRERISWRCWRRYRKTTQTHWWNRAQRFLRKSWTRIRGWLTLCRPISHPRISNGTFYRCGSNSWLDWFTRNCETKKFPSGPSSQWEKFKKIRCCWRMCGRQASSNTTSWKQMLCWGLDLINQLMLMSTDTIKCLLTLSKSDLLFISKAE